MMEEHERRLTTDDLAANRSAGDELPQEPRDGEQRQANVAAPAEQVTQRSEAEGVREPELAQRQGAPPADVHGGEPEAAEPLFASSESSDLRSQWEAIQTGFVDEPRRAVENADALVAELMQRLAATFSEERRSLEAQWDRGDDVSTEDLRIALQRYRSFFDRLLSA